MPELLSARELREIRQEAVRLAVSFLTINGTKGNALTLARKFETYIMTGELPGEGEANGT